jgi:hypothetical protein
MSAPGRNINTADKGKAPMEIGSNKRDKPRRPLGGVSIREPTDAPRSTRREREERVDPAAQQLLELIGTFGSHWTERSTFRRTYDLVYVKEEYPYLQAYSAREGEEATHHWDVRAPSEYERVCSPHEGLIEWFMWFDIVSKDYRVFPPFNLFQMGVIRSMDCAPAQISPNAWGFIKAFERVCEVFNLKRSTNVFFYFFQGSITSKRHAISFQARPHRQLLSMWTESVKGYHKQFYVVRCLDKEPCWWNKKEKTNYIALSWVPFEKVTSPSVRYEELKPKEKDAVRYLLSMKHYIKCKDIITGEEHPNWHEWIGKYRHLYYERMVVSFVIRLTNRRCCLCRNTSCQRRGPARARSHNERCRSR